MDTVVRTLLVLIGAGYHIAGGESGGARIV